MSLLLNETEANFKAFDGDWRNDMAQVATELAKDSAVYLASYRRLASLQAWRAFLETRMPEGSLAFFLEAQNDALTSHVFANLGSWRSALKALRSCIDNVLFCVYYKDHPVELELWHSGNHKPTFSELFTYLDNHPARIAAATLDACPTLRNEYATLSKAVHASAKSFRMTNNIKETLLWSAAPEQKGKWRCREQVVIASINLLLLALFRNELSGASAAGLRDAIGLALPPSMLPEVKTHMNVVVRKP
ncbi:MAG TPA: hypothetical protein VFK06_22450 [Candidatus Angelobacter sp.]|nr:hypothetical protein [Candidatus Angelobacter sp.]